MIVITCEITIVSSCQERNEHDCKATGVIKNGEDVIELSPVPHTHNPTNDPLRDLKKKLLNEAEIISAETLTLLRATSERPCQGRGGPWGPPPFFLALEPQIGQKACFHINLDHFQLI